MAMALAVAARRWTAAPALRSAASTAASAAGSARGMSTTTPAHGIEAFFGPNMYDPKATPAGRAWKASELRQKSFDDLHGLWFACLRERNMLLTERLWFRQGNMAAPDGTRLNKVKDTMARIKVVLGERFTAHKDLRTVRGEDWPKQAPAYSDDLLLVKKEGRVALAPADHPSAVTPSAAEAKRGAYKAKRFARWKGRLSARKGARQAVPDEALGYAFRRPGTPVELEREGGGDGR